MGSNVQIYRSPSLSTNGNTCRISHREYLTPVTSTTTDFTVFKFYLNPGVASTFPWLYYIANNFELYKFLKLQFEYLPRCSSASFGSVTIAIDYDAADSAPLTKSEVIMFATQKTSSVWQPMSVSCADNMLGKRGHLFTRMDTEAGDIKTYDIAQVFVCIEGVPASTVGEVYCTYDLELLEPQLNMGGVGRDGGLSYGTAGMTPAKIFGTTNVSLGDIFSKGIAHIVDNGTNNAVVFDKVWEGLVDWFGTGTGFTSSTTSGTATHSPIKSLLTTTDINNTVKVQADIGQTLIPIITGTTVTTGAARFAEANYVEL